MSQVGDDPALIIANTGDDVPPDEVAALFEPFRRRTGARIDHSGGAGLGLAIARSITQAHEGTHHRVLHRPRRPARSGLVPSRRRIRSTLSLCLPH